MAAAEAETATELRAELAALRMRVQVWNPSRSCDLCFAISSLNCLRGCFFLLPETWGWMWPGVAEGEPEAGHGCFDLHLQIQGDALHLLSFGCIRGVRAVRSLSLADMRELPS